MARGEKTEMTNEELARMLKGALIGVVSFNSWRERNVGVEPDFSGFDFTGAKLFGARLTRVNFTGAKLDGANLAGADLGGANLTRASLTGASLSGADLYGAILRETVITAEQLASTRFQYVRHVNPEVVKRALEIIAESIAIEAENWRDRESAPAT